MDLCLHRLGLRLCLIVLRNSATQSSWCCFLPTLHFLLLTSWQKCPFSSIIVGEYHSAFHTPIIAPEEYPQDYYNQKFNCSVSSCRWQRSFQGCMCWLSRECAWCKNTTAVTFVGSPKWWGTTKRKTNLFVMLDITWSVTWLTPCGIGKGSPFLTPEQHTYNYRLSSAWSVVEICFVLYVSLLIKHTEADVYLANCFFWKTNWIQWNTKITKKCVQCSKRVQSQ